MKNRIVVYLLSILIGTLVLGGLSVAGYYIYQDSNISPESVLVTNVTDTGAAYTWYTEDETIGRIKVKEVSGSWLDGDFYDDRDMKQDTETGEYVLKDKGAQKRHTHHVSIRGLEPEKEYEVVIAGTLLNIDTDKDGSDLPNITTKELNEDIKTPDPAYGKIEGMDDYEDSFVIMTKDSWDETREFVKLSAVVSEDSTYSIDLVPFAMKEVKSEDLHLQITASDGTVYEHDYIIEGYKPLEKILVGEQSGRGELLDNNLISPVAALTPNTDPISGDDCGVGSKCEGGSTCNPGTPGRENNGLFQCLCGGETSGVNGSPAWTRGTADNPTVGYRECGAQIIPDGNTPETDETDVIHVDGSDDCDTLSANNGLQYCPGCHSGDRHPSDSVVLCQGGAYCIDVDNNLSNNNSDSDNWCGSNIKALDEYQRAGNACYLGGNCGPCYSKDVDGNNVRIRDCGTNENCLNLLRNEAHMCSTYTNHDGTTGDVNKVTVAESPDEDQEMESDFGPIINEDDPFTENLSIYSPIRLRLIRTDQLAQGDSDNKNSEGFFVGCQGIGELYSGDMLLDVRLHLHYLKEVSEEGTAIIEGIYVAVPVDANHGLVNNSTIKNRCKSDDTQEDVSSSEEKSRLSTYTATKKDVVLGDGLMSAVQAASDKLVTNESGNYVVYYGDNFEQPISEFAVNLDGADRAEIRLFVDTNGNGKKDKDEPVLEDYSSLSLKKESEVATYTLNAGWNLITMPLISSDGISTASELLDHFNNQGADVKHIAKYTDSGFEMYTKRENDQEFSNDYNIVPGHGYFVLNYEPQEVKIKGRKFDEAIPFRVRNGWNLVGVYTNEAPYTAEELLKDMEAEGIEADVVSKYEGGLYTSVVYEDDVLYGNDYNIFERAGYFVRVNSGGGSEVKFTPTPEE
ncbi:hypothetical protein GF389_02200 [Candidatus Dojkabacteria bacterium]|nr:hypothetical protein [Candidatus Dojkabacteria bacterium]